jgi:hypothetical protein
MAATNEAMRTNKADLVQVDRALQSSRDAGYDLTAAVGEVVDNSIDWGKASIVRIRTDSGSAKKKIEQMAFADNGDGIGAEILPHVLSLGFSTGYGSRQGIGRFGVGLKLATLALAPRVDIYTRSRADGLLHTHLDLKEVSEGKQKHIEARRIDDYPDDLADLMATPNGEPFETGTLVVWSRIDRLEDGGRYGSANQERLQELMRFLGRAYRRFIDNGLSIELNNRTVLMHDPLFLLANKRVTKRFGEDIRGTIIDRETIEIDGHEVEVTVSLLPEEFRHHKGQGGRAELAGDEFEDLYIPDNEGKISFLRQGREINYDLVARMLPYGKQRLDRFIGIEVSFPAALDEYFEVRNVKRGAVPVSKLREELRQFLNKPIKAARREIRRHWSEIEMEERAANPEHEAAETAVARAEKTTPRGRAGADMTSEEERDLVEEKLDEVFDEETPENERGKLRDRLEELPFSIVDHSWPGKELMQIDHRNGGAIILLNQKHPFIADIYSGIKAMANRDEAEVDPADAIELARRTEAALDVLLIAYAKAENMHPDPEEAFGDLCSDWGRFCSTYLRQTFKEIDD